ncbi:MAG: psd [Bacilli bacterium]|nr:psd [Bacilli bacterium]
MGFNWKLACLYFLPKKPLSSWVGKWASSKFSRPFIPFYIRWFKIDPTLAEKPLTSYTCLTDFFTRKLKAELRPVDADPSQLVSPVDGVVSGLGIITSGSFLQAKGVTYSIASLLGDEEKAKLFDGGMWITFYLSPKDYHRIHAPMEGQFTQYVYIPGSLWPVNPIGVAGIPGLFSKNERIITYLDTVYGHAAMVKVGAMIVGSIEVHYDPSLKTNRFSAAVVEKKLAPPVQVQKGEEIGLFKFGSTVILLFEPDLIEFDPRLVEGTVVQMGQTIAAVKRKQPDAL